ncbi:ferritin-like domain-containing protein [Scytonema sp. UIC 10036]|uniref:ferritin-like domain-containing protein n=1 Tax=Scytonema sp. UIC 10036 TaxID=2304196 RepID=UPI0012DA272C|nr:ferritin-like domain-containing protein [Scytonema sp. UIC 10036]MUG91453.1 ferritin-like domain-containing protein [Scytonema sp. UIC 10036]
MKLGSQNHKELFCRSFIESHIKFEPEQLSWPTVDSVTLERLRSIPFWQEALSTEQKAGAMVHAFAQTIADPLLRDAIALQGMEETRHFQLIKFLIEHYKIPISQTSEPVIPNNIQTAFIDFGFGECLDSFLAFGMFGIARQAGYMPEAFFHIFDPILNEEARHITFFINWVTYLQIQEGKKANWLRGVYALWHYNRALQQKIAAFKGSNEERNKGFTATGAMNFMDNLTPELFLSTCLAENTKRMSVFDKQLLRPQLLPTLAKIALHVLKLMPQHQYGRNALRPY